MSPPAKKSLNWMVFILLAMAHVLWTFRPKQHLIHPYIPPLTHTPGMGLSPIAKPSPPLWLLLQHRPKTIHCKECDELFQTRSQSLLQAKNHRLQFQETLALFLDELPSNTLQHARNERLIHEETIGEMSIWNQLQFQY